MKIATFEEWKAIKISFIASQAKEGKSIEIKCHECNGDGSIEDFGEITGQAFDADCPECEGCGVWVITGVECDEDIKKIKLSSLDYEKELVRDLVDLARWSSRDVEDVLNEHGFDVCYREYDKAMVAIGSAGSSFSCKQHVISSIH